MVLVELVCGAEGQTRAASRRSNQIRKPHIRPAKREREEWFKLHSLRLVLMFPVSRNRIPNPQTENPASLGRHSGKLPDGGGGQ